MKKVIKYFMFTVVLLTTATLTSCDDFKSSTLKRIKAEGLEPSYQNIAVDFETWQEAEKTTYTMLKDTRFFEYYNPKDLNTYFYFELRVKNDITGEILDAYSYSYDWNLAMFSRLKKGQKVCLYMEKDKLDRNRILRGDIDRSIYY